MSSKQISQLYSDLETQYQNFQNRGLSLDMTRGKPAPEQLDLSNELLKLPGHQYRSAEQIDCRNYGGLDGLSECRNLFAKIMRMHPDQVLVLGNSSLTLMFDALMRAYVFGVPGGELPWGQVADRKFLCPCPGYDRHFSITEALNFKLIPIEMTGHGPNMDQVESLVAKDESIKGIWCVPQYSNPSGETYSSDVVERLARMESKANDFRIFWDNAYAEHHLYEPVEPLTDIYPHLRAANRENHILMFASTSKISYPGAGLASLAASQDNIAQIKKIMALQTIGPDKINQLRHHQLFPDYSALQHHMLRHREILLPKFSVVDEVLSNTLADYDVASWSKPQGGYFINLSVHSKAATQVIAEAKKAGVLLTNAGAAFPYGTDPEDKYIRIAPSFPEVEEIRQAIGILANCILRIHCRRVMAT